MDIDYINKEIRIAEIRLRDLKNLKKEKEQSVIKNSK